VRYFYERAVAAARQALPAQPRWTGADPDGLRRDGLEPESLLPPAVEAAFRYDGPRPQFRESAVISLADGVEAASRSLRATSAAQLGHLIDGIVAERIEQGQLNEAPLTLEDIAKIKNSFTFTLLNMLHGRVAYGEPEKPDEERARAESP